MNKILSLVLILIVTLASCKSNKKTAEHQITETTSQEDALNNAETVQEIEALTTSEAPGMTEKQLAAYKPKLADNVFFYMNLTPCFGKCAAYTVTVDQGGIATLNGRKFFDYIGKYQTKFTEDDMVQIASWAEEVNYWEMNHVYDAPITDLPSATTYLNANGKEQWVYAKMDAPESLAIFQRNIETLIKDKQWEPAEKGMQE